MQKDNFNQQSLTYRKRRCMQYKPNDFFQSFDRSQQQIIQNYEKSAESLMIKSLAILIDNIKKSVTKLASQPSSFQQTKITDFAFHSLKKNMPTFKKIPPEKAQENSESTNPEKEIKQMVIFQKTGKKLKSQPFKQYCLEDKSPQTNYLQKQKHDNLIKELNRLSMADQFQQLTNELQNIPHSENINQSESNNIIDDETIKNKSLTDLLSESNQKVQQLQSNQSFQFQSENSEYEITDHSSNESSDEDFDYEERFAFQAEKNTLFGGLFSHGTNPALCFNKFNSIKSFSTTPDNPPLPKLSFKPLLDSPKKQKTKKKRLFINKKKVPRWAEDLNEVAQVYASQRQRILRQNVNETIGICIVENMQTNSIFNINEKYNRSSTAKWNKQQFTV